MLSGCGLKVVATDIPSEGEIVQSSEVRVMVTVTDVNDNAPEITQPGQYSHIVCVKEKLYVCVCESAPSPTLLPPPQDEVV